MSSSVFLHSNRDEVNTFQRLLRSRVCRLSILVGSSISFANVSGLWSLFV